MVNRFHFNLNTLSPELNLVINCLREIWQPESEWKSTSEPLDWRGFMWWAERHRVAPFIYQAVQHSDSVFVPDEVYGWLKGRAERNLRRNMLLAAEVSRLAKLFQERGIPVLFFKGVTLAWKLYGNIDLRYVGDIDLMISPSQAELAEQLLHEAGYQGLMPDFQGTMSQRNQFKRTIRDKEYLRRESETKVELHWRLSHFRYLLPLDFEYLLSRAQIFGIAGQAVPIFSDEDMWLHLFEHGASHAWYRLFWLCDAAELLRQNLDIDWDRLIVRARELKVLRPLVQGVMLAHFLLGAPVPAPVRNLAERDPAAIYLVQTALHHIQMPEPIHMLPLLENTPDRRGQAWRHLSNRARMKIAYETRLHGDFSHKIGVLKEFVSARPADLFMVRLPAFLFPLYYLLRPFLWGWRRLLRQAPPQK